jgi:hypothetical protein
MSVNSTFQRKKEHEAIRYGVPFHKTAFSCSISVQLLLPKESILNNHIARTDRIRTYLHEDFPVMGPFGYCSLVA